MSSFESRRERREKKFTAGIIGENGQKKSP